MAITPTGKLQIIGIAAAALAVLAAYVYGELIGMETASASNNNNNDNNKGRQGAESSEGKCIHQDPYGNVHGCVKFLE